MNSTLLYDKFRALAPHLSDHDWESLHNYFFYEIRCCGVELSNAKQSVTDARDFIYDKGTRLILINVAYICHAKILAYLYNFYTAIVDGKGGFKEFQDLCDQENSGLQKGADKYIEHHRGFFLSSVGNGKITIGEGYIKTPQEKIIFKNFKFMEL